MPITAFAPCWLACSIINSRDSSRVFSHISSNRVILPPTRVSSDAPSVPRLLRERTVTPRTSPKLFTTRYPGKSNAVVTIFGFTLTPMDSSPRSSADAASTAEDSTTKIVNARLGVAEPAHQFNQQRPLAINQCADAIYFCGSVHDGDGGENQERTRERNLPNGRGLKPNRNDDKQ